MSMKQMKNVVMAMAGMVLPFSSMAWYGYESNGGIVLGARSWNVRAVEQDTAGDLEIPPVLGESLPVVGISEWAFQGCSKLTSVLIPDSVTYISGGAFQDCTGLTAVSIGTNVNTLGISCFQGCTKLQSIEIPDGVKSIPMGAFAFCSSLGRLKIGNGVTEVNGDINMSSMLGIAGRTVTVQNSPFWGCTSLRGIEFGSGIKSVSWGTFSHCTKLKYVYFSGKLPSFYGSMPGVADRVCYITHEAYPDGLPSQTWAGAPLKYLEGRLPSEGEMWDLDFCQPKGWLGSFCLSAVTNAQETCTRFLKGNPIYMTYAFTDNWGIAPITKCFTNEFHLSLAGRVDCDCMENGMELGSVIGKSSYMPAFLQDLDVGEYTVSYILNSNSAIRETEYANNTNYISFVVVPSTAVTFMSLDYDVGTFNFEKGGTYGSKLPDAPVRFGYKFVGWFTAEEDGIRITESSRVPDDPTTLYAQWIAAPNETITVSSNPTAGTTWQSGNLYVVAENITVPSGIVLTIQPGAIVKFKAGKSLTIASGGTLRAQGTRAMPIVFTSINDDANGGKTDGSTSKPNGGDWNRIQVNGTALFEFCKIYYTSGTENYGGIECGGTVTFDNSEIAETKYECVNAHSGSFTAHNSVFRDSSLAFGYYGGSRVKVYNCVVANCTTAVRQSGKLFYNTIFYNCRNFTDQGGDGSKFYYCCFYNPTGYGDQNSAKYARETCIWADPQFVNVDKNDYRIKAASPCVDAADGTVAPEFDHYGSPRMNVENVRPTGTAAADGAVPDIGIYEVPGSADVPAADLTVTGVSAPEVLTIGKTARISWTVENVGEVDAYGQWVDVVEIVTANGQILELGEQVATLDVRTGKSQTFAGDFVIPCGTEGQCRVRVTANKYRDLFEGGRMDNNAGTTTDASELVVETKTVPTDGSETSVILGAGNETAFALGYFGDSSALLAIRCEGDVSAWLGNGNTATKGNAIRTAVQVASDLWLLEIPAGTDARVSLGNDGLEPFSVALSMAVGDFLLCDIGKVTSLNTGTVTVPFAGIGFEDGISCWLSLNGNRVADAKEIFVNDAVSGSAVFDVHGLAPGVYSICVKKGDEEDSVAALELIRAQDAAARWNCGLDLAATIRANRTYVGRFEYENLGDAPMNVPYITLQSSGGTLIRLSESDAWTDSIDVLALSSTYPASSLKPGEVGEIKFFYRTKSERANVTFKCAGATRVVDENGRNFAVSTAQPMQNGVVIYQDAHKKIIRYTIVTKVSHADDPVDWPNVLVDCRPHNVDALPWSFSNPKLAEAFGTTWRTYIARLAEDADYLMRLGQPTYRVDKLLQLEMNDALGIDNAVPVLASSADIVRSGRGLDLSFTRTYSPSMTRRLTKGMLGYGWYGSYSTYAQLKDENTLVFYMPSGSSYSFTKVSGAWEPEDSRDQTVLTESDAAYELASPSGMVQKYSKGTMRLASISDNQGNSLTFAYAGTKVSRVTHSDGQYLSFAYSGDLLTSVSDDLGHTVSYAYDNNRLATVTRVDGLVTNYGYRGDDGSSCAKALVQITAPNGTTRDFTYGSDGRLATISVNGDKQTTRIMRGKFGSYSIIAPDGGETTVTEGVNGETLKTVNALGQTVKQTYTADSLLESVIAPSGKRNLISYDKLGNPVSAMSASGATTAFAYTEEYGNLDSVTDPKGQVLAFGYDALGRGVSSKFADGSETRVEYNDKGDIVKTTNRRGQSVAYQYDAQGRLVKKTWDDGRTFTLAYDAKGNVVSASDSRTGTVTMEYDANERLTKIIYPKNRGFTYTYDDAGRVAERASLDGTKECYAYDSFGRLARVTDGSNPYLTNAYDPTTGWLVTQTYGNGTVVSNAYDVLGRTVGIYHLKNGTRLAFFEYAYDADGKCISQTTAEGVESYTYDADGQLIGVTYPDGTSESFTYDAVGNRITANTTTYTVNNLNQYTTLRDSASLREENLTYDLDGNMTCKGDTQYYYDTLNRLVAVTNTAKNIRWSCEYDVFGNRVSVTDNGTTTEKVFVQGSLPSVSAEYVDGSLTKRHILVGAVRLADIPTPNSPTPNSQTLYYHSDLLGSARLLTDGSGTTKGTRSFKAFGETRTSTGETTDAGYVGTLGVETDSNGLLFMRNRYYDAGMGRFVQMDPIGLRGGDFNLYSYCFNNGTHSVDPYGLKVFHFEVRSAPMKQEDASEFCNSTGDPTFKRHDEVYWFDENGNYKGDFGFGAKNKWLFMGGDGIKMHKGEQGLDEHCRIIDQETLDLDENAIRHLDKWVNDYTQKSYWLPFRNCHDFAEDFMKEVRKFLPHDEQVKETRDVVISWDPNEIKGPAGQGEKRYVQQGEWMDYTIYFENKTNATAAAQEVFVDLPMDENLDWTTLELGEIAFGEHIDTSLSGKSHGKTSYAMPGTNTFVKTTVTMKDGVLSWYMRDWDPTTADNFPASATGGFLPPNNPETHCGEGHLSFRVRVKPDAPDGAIIRASAQIVFDNNPMIETDPSWWNTVGEDKPMASFTASEVEAAEGDALTFAVAGGNVYAASSVDVYLTYNTATSADLDPAKAKVNGALTKNLKFPLTLTWAKGEVGEKVITIPVKTDKTVEGDEFFTLQLANAVGMVVGDEDICTVTITDANTYATLQDGVMNPNIKVSTSGDGKWIVGAGARSDEDGSLGLFHVESPTLAEGKKSTLAFGSVKGAGKFSFYVRFTGDPNEETPSSLAIYNGKTLLGSLNHTQVSNVWGRWYIDASKASSSSSHNYSFVFTQGSDPDTHAEVSDILWDTGSATPVYNVLACTDGTGGGYVSGSGPYLKGQTAKLVAKPLPGWVFDGWYMYGKEAGAGDLWNKSASVSLKPTGDLHVIAVFSKIPYVCGLADPADGGKVSGSGLCAAGKKVTLKATANKNYTFLGWVRGGPRGTALSGDGDGRAGSPLPADENGFVATTPSLVIDRGAKPAANSKTSTTITEIDGDVTYFAVFKSDPEIFVTVDATDGTGAEPTGKGAGKYVAGTITGEGKYAPGKTKIALKSAANKGYVFAGWYETSGKLLTKDAAYTIAAMGESDVEYTAKFVTADEDKASIALGVNGEEMAAAGAGRPPYQTNLWCGVYLEWPVAAEALSQPAVKVSGLPSGLKFADKPVTSKVGTGTAAVVVTNVPANTIYGVPTAASKADKNGNVKPSEVKVTVTTAGKSSQTYQIDTTVVALPAWAQGSFVGGLGNGERGTGNGESASAEASAAALALADKSADKQGTVSLTIAANGKVSGKAQGDGIAYTLAAPSYSAFAVVPGDDGPVSNFLADVTASWSYKEGSKTVKTNDVVRMTVRDNGIGGVATGGPSSVSAAPEWIAWQYNWKVDPWKTLGTKFDKATVTYAILSDGTFSEDEEVLASALGADVAGRVTLKFAASGAVSVAGEFVSSYDKTKEKYVTVKASGSATLVPVDEGHCVVFVYLTPKGLVPHVRCLTVPLP